MNAKTEVDQKKDEAPLGAVVTLKVPSRNGELIFHLREIDEAVFLAANTLIDSGKPLDAIRMVIKALLIKGDDPNLLNEDFRASQTASKLIQKFLEPVPGELKKN
jgi:hypothetical protein